MTDLSSAIGDYLKVRRALGHKMELAERLLGQFDIYFERAGATHITNDLAVAWATLPVGASAGWWAQRLGVLRGFAAWLQTLDPDTEVPPADMLTGRAGRVVPYLYSDVDIAAMMEATEGLAFPLQRHTYKTLIGLLAITGLRIGEAIRLDRGDVCADVGLVRVITSKFDKSREVPLHPSSIDALVRYAQQRDRLCPAPLAKSFFVSMTGTRLRYSVVHPTFAKLARQAGLAPRSPRCRPRIHDVRHSFAVRALVDCYAAGGDAQTLLPLLSTFMGHADPKSTYWYLSAAPELMSLAGRRLEDAFEADFEVDG